jgi:hypothetical protein
LFGCDLNQINIDMAVEGAETLLLKLDRHHKAYEIEMQIYCCKFEAMEGGVKRYRFKLVDCAAIVDELDAVDWCSFFSGRVVDQCVYLFYKTVWSCCKEMPYEIFWL